MPVPDAIPADKLAKLIGTPRCPTLLDVRAEAVRAADPRLVPAARALGEAEITPDALARLTAGLTGPVVVICAEGHRRSQGVAALLRSAGVPAEYLEGGQAAWVAAGFPLVDPGKLTARDAEGRTVWVTRSRPKIDRIACPWLIRRFVDPRAIFLYVAPAEVVGVAELFGAMPYDIEEVFWSHRGERCTFDTMLDEFGLVDCRRSIGWHPSCAARTRRGSTSRPRLRGCSPPPSVSPGCMPTTSSSSKPAWPLYDAFYRWARDATDETHNWPTNRPGAAR